MRASFKTALVAAVVSAFVAAGAAVATTQTFMLGINNRVDAPSSVTNLRSGGTVNPVDAPLLTLENKSTTANATPLSLLAASNHAPLKINTGVKVTNLNADRLDGFDSTGFIQGTGAAVSQALRVVPDTGVRHALLTVPGFGSFNVQCFSGTSTFAALNFANGTDSTMDATIYDNERESTLHTLLVGLQVDPQGILDGWSELSNGSDVAANETTWQLSTTDGSKVATALTTILFDDAGDCIFRASAVENG